MKKKLLSAIVLSALTLSASSVFASPAFSGDSYLEYDKIGNNPSILENRIRLNADANIDGIFNVHARAKMINELKDGSGANTISMDQAYIGAKLKGADIKVGRQSLFSGKGLLMDDDNFNGAGVSTSYNDVKMSGFYGKDSNNVKSVLADVGTSFNGINLGANYLTLGDKHYYGVNVDTKIMNDAVLNVEYVKNNTDNASGYIAGITKNNYTVSYRDIDPNAIDSHTTNGNYVDSKGFKISAHYDISKNSSVTLYHDLATDHANNDKHRTNVEFDVNF